MAERSEIDAVRDRTDIVSVIEQYVSLKRAGRNYKGLCPFHNEKTPSFQVNPEIGRWNCFGQCGESGDVFKFIEKIENLSFAEALERLAIRAGVTLTNSHPGGQVGGAGSSGSPNSRETIHDINSVAVSYYAEQLFSNPMARNYLADRGYDPRICKKYKLGYAPDSWDGLSNYLGGHKASLEHAEAAGLIGQRDRGGYYDRIRNRIVFPIFDVQNRPIAFGARLLGSAVEGQPKYWNSPETAVFSKSKTLYGLPFARKAIAAAEQAVIVEGYTDVISAHESGFENVVATLGTSLTEDHVTTLSRLSSSAVLAFDADSAGLRAAVRAGEIFTAHGVSVRVMTLSDGDDPDSMLRAGRKQEFANAIVAAVPLTEYRIRLLVKNAKIESDDDRVILLNKAVAILASVPTEIERSRYIGMVETFHPRYRSGSTEAEQQILRDVKSYVAARRQNIPPRALYLPGSSAHGCGAATLGDATGLAVKHLIRGLMSGDVGVIMAVITGTDEICLGQSAYQETLKVLINFWNRNGYINPNQVINECGNDSIAHLFSQLLTDDSEPISIPVVLDAIEHLKYRAVEDEVAKLKTQIDGGNADAITLRRFIDLNSQLKGTKAPH